MCSAYEHARATLFGLVRVCNTRSENEIHLVHAFAHGRATLFGLVLKTRSHDDVHLVHAFAYGRATLASPHYQSNSTLPVHRQPNAFTCQRTSGGVVA